MKITILEFAPCADSIYHLRRDEEEGYVAGDGRLIEIRSGAKLRPRAISTYAGGKATNVARVMDRLMNEDDDIEAELIVFRPDSPEGRYIHDLQVSALSRVAIRPVIIEGRARICVDLTDPSTDPSSRVTFNISPRALWQRSALDAAMESVSRISTDVLLLAGNPPVFEPDYEMASGLYAAITEEARPRIGVISVDVEKAGLARCLQAAARPDVIKINSDEHRSVDEKLWENYPGTLVVTDAEGCTVKEMGREARRVEGVRSGALYSTIGAGDAVHAGFTLARWVWGFDAASAARYGQAAAAAAVRSPEGTRGVSKQAVEEFFASLQREAGG